MTSPAEATDRQQLLSELFHALSQPLTALRCSLELALLERKPNGPSRENLQMALVHAEHIARLAGGIRNLIEAEDPGDERIVVSLANCLHVTVLDLQPVAEAAEAKVLLQCDEDCPVLAEPRRLKQAIFYLLEFGVVSTARGETLRIEARQDEGEAMVSLSLAKSEANDESTNLDDRERKSQELSKKLGLAIAGRIFQTAGGKLEINEQSDRIQLRLRMPLAQRRAAAGSSGS